MAHQINPLTPLVTEEIKEINKEDYKESFELSQKEVSRLRGEVKELVLSNEKLVINLAKKKHKLDTERTNSNTFRQLIQELNTHVQLLEGATPPPLLSPTIPHVQNPILNTVINEEFVEKLVIEETGLESQICEPKREIEHLNSELMSCKKELTQQTESQHQEYALNREVTQLRTDLALKEQQLAECQSNFLKLEAECNLGKQLFQEALSSLSAEKEQLLQLLDKERGVNGKLGLEVEQHRNLIDTQRTNLIEQVEQLDTSIAIEVKLQTQINKLQNKILQLKYNENTLRTKINEQNRQMTASTQDMQQTLEMRPNYFPYPPGPIPYAGYHHDSQEQSVPYPQGVNRGRALPEPPLGGSGTKIPQNIGGQMRAIVHNLPNPIRRPGDTIAPVPVPVSPTHRPSLNRNLSGVKFVSEPQISIAKIQSPLSFSNEPRVKVVLVWRKERPTLERKLIFFDSSSQDPLTLVLTEDRELYQGDGSLNMGQHSGSLLFPTTGEMLPVQPFDVIRKPMGMGRIRLKLYEQY